MSAVGDVALFDKGGWVGERLFYLVNQMKPGFWPKQDGSQLDSVRSVFHCFDKNKPFGNKWRVKCDFIKLHNIRNESILCGILTKQESRIHNHSLFHAGREADKHLQLSECSMPMAAVLMHSAIIDGWKTCFLLGHLIIWRIWGKHLWAIDLTFWVLPLWLKAFL